jgi:hypothetical protein
MTAEKKEKKIWILQKRFHAIAITIVSFAAVFGTYTAAKDTVKTKIKTIAAIEAVKIADSLDKCQVEKRDPVDTKILAMLNSIDIQLQKNIYVTEKSMTPARWNQIESAWRSDSVRFKLGGGN